MTYNIRHVVFCVGVKFGDSLQEATVSFRQEFEEGKPFLQLLWMEKCEKNKEEFQ